MLWAGQEQHCPGGNHNAIVLMAGLLASPPPFFHPHPKPHADPPPPPPPTRQRPAGCIDKESRISWPRRTRNPRLTGRAGGRKKSFFLLKGNFTAHHRMNIRVRMATHKYPTGAKPELQNLGQKNTWRQRGALFCGRSEDTTFYFPRQLFVVPSPPRRTPGPDKFLAFS